MVLIRRFRPRFTMIALTRCTHHQPTCIAPLQSSMWAGVECRYICLGSPIYLMGMTLTWPCSVSWLECTISRDGLIDHLSNMWPAFKPSNCIIFSWQNKLHFQFTVESFFHEKWYFAHMACSSWVAYIRNSSCQNWELCEWLLPPLLSG